MKADYDPKDLQSVLLYMGQRFGREIFLSPPRMVAILGDLSPALGPDGNVLRQLGERGLLRELEQAAASGDNMKQTRIVVKIRDFLTNYLFLMDSKVDFYLTALSAVYAVQSPAAPQPQPVSQPKPAPQSKPTPAPAPQAQIVASGQVGDNLTWTLDADGTLTISGRGKWSMMEDYRKFQNQPWKSWQEIIKVVSLKDGVTTIGNGAFYDCYRLTAVTIPPSVTKIGYYAFQGCSGLTAVTIPSSVTYIGDWAFDGCSGLTAVTIPPGVTSIGDFAFRGCSGLTAVTIPPGVTSIGYAAFCECGGLTEVTIPPGVTSIGDFAFHGCSGLTEVTILSSVTSIGKAAFSDCAKLKTAIVPKTLHIPLGTFPSHTQVIRQ